jgi:hypothetical protein
VATRFDQKYYLLLKHVFAAADLIKELLRARNREHKKTDLLTRIASWFQGTSEALLCTP